MTEQIDRRRFLGNSAFVAAALSLPGVAYAAQGRSSVVSTTKGRVHGTVENGLHVFRGLRYGQDTRPRRFQAPRAPEPWGDIADATAFAPSCPQRGDRYASTSEDCLFLNVWTPGPDPRARRPVMVYIHG